MGQTQFYPDQDPPQVSSGRTATANWPRSTACIEIGEQTQYYPDTSSSSNGIAGQAAQSDDLLQLFCADEEPRHQQAPSSLIRQEPKYRPAHEDATDSIESVGDIRHQTAAADRADAGANAEVLLGAAQARSSSVPPYCKSSTLKELKDACKGRGLKISGTKAQLLERLSSSASSKKRSLAVDSTVGTKARRRS